MTEPSQQVSTQARVRQQLRAVCELLADAPDGLQVREVIARVKERVPPTDVELTKNASGSERYDNNLRWWSVDLVKAGWIVKEKGVWRLTTDGRRALQDYPEPAAFGARASELYQEWKANYDAEKQSRETWLLTEELLALLPPGHWTSFGDLSAVVDIDVRNLGRYLWVNRPQGWHRVLRVGGQSSADVYGAEDAADEQHRLLADEGVQIDPRADPARHLDADDLRSLLGPAPGRRAWLVRGSSVRGVDLIPQWTSEGFVSLSASQLPRVDPPYERDAIRAAVESGYSLSYAKREEKIRDLRAFLTRVREDDLVLTTSGGQVYLGEVTGPPEFVDSDGGRSNLRRAAQWVTADSPAEFDDLPPELKSLLKSGADVTDLTEALDLVEALLPPDIVPPPPPPPDVALRHLDAEQADELLVGREWLDEFVDLLNDRRQVILYGPPGTGKTFLAQKVAAAAASAQTVKLVQFHPAYSYEDFFEGYRPATGEAGQVGFQLRPGPFRRIVDDALEHPEQAYVLIVDEINRANLAKVFGELYFLLEYRDEAVDLLYGEDDGRQFRMPKNVYLIGTMNTADRSIALVDAAMRRRFAFLSLHPDDAHVRGVLREWLRRNELPSLGADLLAELNGRIPDKDFKIGPSYLMTRVVETQSGLERIWRTAILPLLEELHYGDEGVDVTRRYGLEALLAAVGTP